MRRNNGITLIALVITIVVLIILAGVVINLTLGENGIFYKAEEAKEEQYQASERETLELVLSEANIEKETNSEYNRDDFLTDMLENEGMVVDEDIIIVDRYAFRIDREKLIIIEELGISNVKIIAKVNKVDTYAGTSYVDITVDTQAVEGVNLKYKYIVGETESEELTTNQYTVESLEPETKYEVQVIVTDETGYFSQTITKEITTQKRTYLYNNGDQCIDITGGWQAVAIGDGSGEATVTVEAPTVTFNSDNMNVFKSAPGGKTNKVGGSIVTSNNINYAEYKKIKILYTASLGSYSGAVIIQVYKNHENPKYPDNLLENLCYGYALTTKTLSTIDISDIEDIESFYIYIQSHYNYSANLNIYEIWLEK